jgi:hypothetical protein
MMVTTWMFNFLCEVVCPLLILQHITKEGLLKGACCLHLPTTFMKFLTRMKCMFHEREIKGGEEERGTPSTHFEDK